MGQMTVETMGVADLSEGSQTANSRCKCRMPAQLRLQTGQGEGIRRKVGRRRGWRPRKSWSSVPISLKIRYVGRTE